MWYTEIVGHWEKVKCEYFEWNVDCSTAGETVWKTHMYKPKLRCWRKQAKLFSSGSARSEPDYPHVSLGVPLKILTFGAGVGNWQPVMSPRF